MSEGRTPYLVRVADSKADSKAASEQPAEKAPDRERWQRVKKILDQVLESGVAGRSQVIEELCNGDQRLREEVDEYLTYMDRAEDLLSEENLGQALSEGATADSLPARAGPYRIEREIGRGGMGIVCLAKRDDGEYERVVALKLIKSPERRGKFARLFWRERQILARLDHPNIARLLDGGTTDEGYAYYAMEFIDGEPLDRYRQRRALTLRDKLRLFTAVCSAVSYAHRNLIIHGDLKPKNVLITREGVPKLLDFGVARILSGGVQTETTTRMPMTPTYASPEQIRGESLTVATDVYSLGVLLYELLSGSYPYGARQSSAAAMRAFLDQNQSPIPLRQHNHNIPRDLENIVMMALRKEPERRYPTVDALCSDIQAFMDGFPVQAAPDTFFYRLGKFTRRNRWAVVAATIAISAIVVSGIMIWREKRQAEMRFQQLRQLAHSVVFELDDAMVDLPGSSHARELLISRGLQYLNGLAQSRNKDAGLTFELAQAYMKIASAQGNLQQANVGDRAGAYASYTKARGLLQDLRAREPGNRQIEISLALVDGDIASLAPQTDNGKAEQLRRESVSLFQDLARRHDANLKDLALAHFYLALAKTDDGKYKDALPLWQQAFSEYQGLAAKDKNTAESERNVGLVEKHIASVYFALEDYPSSLEYDRKAAAIDEKRLNEQPLNPTARMDLSFDLVELGWCLHELQQDHEADDTLNRAIQLRQQVADQDPNDFHARSELESVLRIAGVAKCEAGDLAGAIQLIQQAADIGTKLHQRDPHNLDETLSASLDNYELGEVFRKRALWHRAAKQDWQSALTCFKAAQTLASQLSPTAVYDANDREKLAQLPQRIAECSEHAIS